LYKVFYIRKYAKGCGADNMGFANTPVLVDTSKVSVEMWDYFL